MPLGHRRGDNSKAQEWQDKLCTVPGDMCTVLEAWAASCPGGYECGVGGGLSCPLEAQQFPTPKQRNELCPVSTSRNAKTGLGSWASLCRQGTGPWAEWGVPHPW